MSDYLVQPTLQKTIDSLMSICVGSLRVKLLGALRNLSRRALEAKMGFQKFHVQFLKLCIENRFYHLCLETIEHPVVIVIDLSFENVPSMANSAARAPLLQLDRAYRLRALRRGRRKA